MKHIGGVILSAVPRDVQAAARGRAEGQRGRGVPEREEKGQDQPHRASPRGGAAALDTTGSAHFPEESQ